MTGHRRPWTSRPAAATGRGEVRSPRLRDAGRISVFVAATMPAMVIFLGLMWDASSYLRALHRVDNIAAEAARAAGQAINVSQAIGDGVVVVDQAAAEQAVAEYTADAGVTGEVYVNPDNQREVQVVITADWEPAVLGVFGFGPRVVSGEATAYLIEQ